MRPPGPFVEDMDPAGLPMAPARDFSHLQLFGVNRDFGGEQPGRRAVRQGLPPAKLKISLAGCRRSHPSRAQESRCSTCEKSCKVAGERGVEVGRAERLRGLRGKAEPK